MGERFGRVLFLKEYGSFIEDSMIKELVELSMSVLDENTLKRELEPLKQIKDNYPKYLLTLDFITGDNEGIKQMNLIDWLLA